MSYRSALRRSSSSIHCFPVVHRLPYRQFSTAPPPPESSQSLNSSGSNGKTNILRLISAGVITSSALALFLYQFSPVDSSSLSFADWSPQVPAFLTGAFSQLTGRDQTKESKFIFGDAFRRKIFFNYEKRIRMRSPPEKVFEYFASVRPSEGKTYMTPGDLMRALVPVFPPSESQLVRDGYLQGERSPGELRCAPSTFFMLFDTNNDGLISFKEYLFFVTLLSIPESSFSVAFKMFDLDCNGEIDRDEFKKVMTLMRAHNRQGASHSDGLRAGSKFSGSVENGGLVAYFFGEDGKKRLHHDKFVQFLRDLHDEMVNLEFAHYDYKLHGTISAKDFALSMVASADMKHLNKLLDRVNVMDNDLEKIRITREEFKSFAELRQKLEPFSLALFSFGKINGLLTRKDLQRAAEQVCGISLTDNMIEVIFHVFDTNSDGSLSAQEFVRVLQKRQRDIAQPSEAGFMNFLSCCGGCTYTPSLARLIN